MHCDGLGIGRPCQMFPTAGDRDEVVGPAAQFLAKCRRSKGRYCSFCRRCGRASRASPARWPQRSLPRRGSSSALPAANDPAPGQTAGQLIDGYLTGSPLACMLPPPGPSQPVDTEGRTAGQFAGARRSTSRSNRRRNPRSLIPPIAAPSLSVSPCAPTRIRRAKPGRPPSCRH